MYTTADRADDHNQRSEDEYTRWQAEQYELAETIGAAAAQIKTSTIDRSLSMPRAIAQAERQSGQRIEIESAYNHALAEAWKCLPEHQEARRRKARDEARARGIERDRKRRRKTFARFTRGLSDLPF